MPVALSASPAGARVEFARPAAGAPARTAAPYAPPAAVKVDVLDRTAAKKAGVGGALVLAAAPAASGPSGDFAATPMAASGRWSTDLNGGSFAWSYDIGVPPVPGDLKPGIGLSYSSASIDGRSANSNNQSSWAGDGFAMGQGFVERAYKPCADDGVENNGIKPGDLCWAYDNATISFDGHSGELISVGTDEWRIQGDDGTKVTRVRDSARGNGDDDGEYFKAVTPDGTQYYFGYNRLPNWAAGKPETKSVYTVPVFGDDAKEPCHAATFATSWCQQGWRWNLDLVVDTKGNDITYWYKPEMNSYGRNMKAADDTPYTRGGTLERIEYGQQQSDIPLRDGQADGPGVLRHRRTLPGVRHGLRLRQDRHQPPVLVRHPVGPELQGRYGLRQGPVLSDLLHHDPPGHDHRADAPGRRLLQGHRPLEVRPPLGHGGQRLPAAAVVGAAHRAGCHHTSGRPEDHLLLHPDAEPARQGR
ncbi:hypothetical protein [Streptomyces yangpuensis]|uniref:hypothetical protein n=1 Tax=Streptomyces yangpuensis TaxID=1648182 RepID=UPI00367C14F7